MSLGDIGAIANMLSALGVLATLVYLSRQVRQGNLLTRFQVRQRNSEQGQEELYQWMANPDLHQCFVKPGELTAEESRKLHYFLPAAMRQRELEWYLFTDGLITEDVYRGPHEVIGLHLGVPRTRRWWASVGRVAYNPGFVADVDALLKDRPLTDYFERVLNFDQAGPEAA